MYNVSHVISDTSITPTRPVSITHRCYPKSWITLGSST